MGLCFSPEHTHTGSWTHIHLSLLQSVWTACNTSSTFSPDLYLYSLQDHGQSTSSWTPQLFQAMAILYLESLQGFCSVHCLVIPVLTCICILISESHYKSSFVDTSWASFWAASIWDSLSLMVLPLLSLTGTSSHGLYLPATHSKCCPLPQKRKRNSQ